MVGPAMVALKRWERREKDGMKERGDERLSGCLDVFFWSLNFRHSSLITLKYHVCLAPSLNIFHTICEPHTCHPVQLFFFQYLNSPNLVKKKKKKKPKKANQEKKGEKKVKSCGWVLFVGLLCVFNYNIAIELWVMETENSQNVFLVFITHNSTTIL